MNQDGLKNSASRNLEDIVQEYNNIMSNFWKLWRRAIRYIQKGVALEGEKEYEKAIACYNRSKKILNKEEEYLRKLRGLFI